MRRSTLDRTHRRKRLTSPHAVGLCSGLVQPWVPLSIGDDRTIAICQHGQRRHPSRPHPPIFDLTRFSSLNSWRHLSTTSAVAANMPSHSQRASFDGRSTTCINGSRPTRSRDTSHALLCKRAPRLCIFTLRHSRRLRWCATAFPSTHPQNERRPVREEMEICRFDLVGCFGFGSMLGDPKMMTKE